MKFGLENISRAVCGPLPPGTIVQVGPDRGNQRQRIGHRNGASRPARSRPARRALHVAASRAARRTVRHRRHEIETRRLAAAVGRYGRPRKRCSVPGPWRRRRRSSSAQPPPPSNCFAKPVWRSPCSRSDSAAGSTPPTSPTLSSTAVTSIGFDHQAQLGDTLESIAFEKAGIIRPGVPVICGDLPLEADGVIAEICRERSAPLIRASASARISNGGSDRHPSRSPAGISAAMRRWPPVCCRASTRPGAGDRCGDSRRADRGVVAGPPRTLSIPLRGVLLDAAHNPGRRPSARRLP